MSAKQAKPTRRAAAMAVIALALAASILAGCDVAKAGGRCSSGFARDNTHVLNCQKGRWTRWKTFREYLLWLQSMQATTTTTTVDVPASAGSVSTTTTSPATTTTTTTVPPIVDDYDRLLGIGGAEPNGAVQVESVSADGRFVSLSSTATNLVPDDSTGATPGFFGPATDVFVWDRVDDTIERQPLGVDGTEPNQPSLDSDLSADGRYVTFESIATNLVAETAGGFPYATVYVWDRVTDTVERQPPGVAGATPSSWDPTISADGQFIAFATTANNLRPGDSAIDRPQFGDVYVWDRHDDTYERLDVRLPGVDRYNANVTPSISDDGSRIAFAAERLVLQGQFLVGAPALVGVWDRDHDTVVRQPLGVGATEPEYGSRAPQISADGSTVAFESPAANLVAGDTNGAIDVFAWDIDSSTVTRQPTDGWPATIDVEQGRLAGISGDGQLIAILHTHQISGSVSWLDPEVGIWDRTDDSVTLQPDGAQGRRPAATTLTATLAADGSTIVTSTDDATLLDGDANGRIDIYAWDIG